MILGVRKPYQQCRSTEGRRLVNRVKGQPPIPPGSAH